MTPRTNPKQPPVASVAPYRYEMVSRFCHREGCDEVFKAHNAAERVWCSIECRRRDPEGNIG